MFSAHDRFDLFYRHAGLNSVEVSLVDRIGTADQQEQTDTGEDSEIALHHGDTYPDG